MRTIVAFVICAIGAGIMAVGGVQIYLAAVTELVGTQAFQFTNGELATMGINVFAFGATAMFYGSWLGE